MALYEDVQEFWVAERTAGGRLRRAACDVGGPGRDPHGGGRSRRAGRGVGHRLVERLLEQARELGVARVFVLTFEVRVLPRVRLPPIDGAPVPHEVYEELLRSFDEGVAEFLDLERVKPNTLGNTRMLLHL